MAQGPLINQAGLAKVERMSRMRFRSARRPSSAENATRLGRTFEPTVLIDVNAGMRLAAEETFGTCSGAALCFRRDDEAIQFAQRYSLWSRRRFLFAGYRPRLPRYAEKLEFGIVGVNDGIISTEGCAFRRREGIRSRARRLAARCRRISRMKYMFLGGLSD